METAEKLITEKLDVWTSAVKAKSSAGRGSSNKRELYGIQKLRGLILDLAVMGKLVAQDPEDEPAHSIYSTPIKLPSDYTRTKKQKVKGRNLLSQDTLPKLPESWSYISIDELYQTNHILDYADGNHGSLYPRKGDFGDTGVLFLTAAQISKNNKILWDECPRLRKDYAAKLSKGWATVGDVFFTHNATVGRTAIAKTAPESNFLLGTSVTYYRINNCTINAGYLHLFFTSTTWYGQAAEVMQQTTRNQVSISKQALFYIALPPLAEQHRIVAKVDELMALCDQLEQEQESSLETHDTLVATLLGALTTSTANAGQFTEAWQRIQANFDTLFTTESSIDQLKQTILQLAVMGKLVAQDPSDETASELLSRLDVCRSKLLKSDYPNAAESKVQLRKQKNQSVHEDVEPLPYGWEWATLMQSSLLLVDCHNKTAPYVSDGIPLIRTTNIRDGELNFKEPKFITEETYRKWAARTYPEHGDILITREAPMGEACIIPEGIRLCMGQRMMLIRTSPDFVNARYILLTIRAPSMMDRVQDKPVGATVQHLRVGGVESMLVPIPPLAEQHRIVAKVDELMALCDQLKANLATAQTTQLNLADSLVEQAIG